MYYLFHRDYSYFSTLLHFLSKLNSRSQAIQPILSRRGPLMEDDTRSGYGIGERHSQCVFMCYSIFKFEQISKVFEKTAIQDIMR